MINYVYLLIYLLSDLSDQPNQQTLWYNQLPETNGKTSNCPFRKVQPWTNSY